ncbi:uncharacterized protein LOC105382585 isoform X3 [Plutella xylostella]|uniref:uncharacterized protein LOC105382585 isoform X3 n=1 Tax=Plutella xylostella TaxID=51655 RepID=UPI00203247C1|nr:uncharacterized protein LOC105382585 isoform X3 [Plutella xylostella]
MVNHIGVGAGVVSCRVALDRGAYVPGESIALTATIVNNSRHAIKASRAALTEVCVFLSCLYQSCLLLVMLSGRLGAYVSGESITLTATIVNNSRHAITSVRGEFYVAYDIVPTKLLSKVVSCRVALDRGAYVPGESVALTATIVNNSRHAIKASRAALTETIQYSAHGKLAAKEVRELAVLRHGKTRAGEADRWRGELLYVPPLPPTNLRGCHLITVSYDVFFIIEPKSLEKEVKLQLPILLGTYPFRDEHDEAPHPPTHYPSTLPIFRPWLHEKH